MSVTGDGECDAAGHVRGPMSWCAGTRAVYPLCDISFWLLFLYGALDSHPFLPSRAASGYRLLMPFWWLVTAVSGSCCWVAFPACVLVVCWAHPVRRCSAL